MYWIKGIHSLGDSPSQRGSILNLFMRAASEVIKTTLLAGKNEYSFKYKEKQAQEYAKILKEQVAKVTASHCKEGKKSEEFHSLSHCHEETCINITSICHKESGTNLLNKQKMRNLSGDSSCIHLDRQIPRFIYCSNSKKSSCSKLCGKHCRYFYTSCTTC